MDRGLKEWVLEIKGSGSGEIRILYHNGKEDKKTSRENDGDTVTIKEWKGGSLKKVTVYKDGRILREMTSESTSVFVWGKDNIREIKHFRNGDLVFTDKYLIGSKGVIYRITRVFPDGREETAGYNYGKGGITGQWNTEGESSILLFYKDNDLDEIDNYKGGELVSSTKYGSEADDSFQQEYNAGTGENVRRKYNGDGKIIEEEISSPGKVRIVYYSYNSSGLLSEKLIKEPGYREKHLYFYGAEGTEESEEVYKNNNLYKKIRYMEDGKREETVFRNGKPLKKVIIKDDVVIENE